MNNIVILLIITITIIVFTFFKITTSNLKKDLKAVLYLVTLVVPIIGLIVFYILNVRNAERTS